MTIDDNARLRAASGWTPRRFGLLAGAILSALSCRYHIAAGTPQVMGPVHASGIPPQAAAVLDVIWLQIAALLAGGGIAMTIAAFKTEWRRPLAWLIGGHYLVIAAISFVYSFIWFGSPTGLMQWALFGGLALLLFWAGLTKSDR